MKQINCHGRTQSKIIKLKQKRLVRRQIRIHIKLKRINLDKLEEIEKGFFNLEHRRLSYRKLQRKSQTHNGVKLLGLYNYTAQSLTKIFTKSLIYKYHILRLSFNKSIHIGKIVTINRIQYRVINKD